MGDIGSRVLQAKDFIHFKHARCILADCVR